MTHKYQVTSRQGVELGTFEAESPEDALDALAREAGCESHEAVCHLLGTDPNDWTTSVSRFQEGNAALLVLKE